MSIILYPFLVVIDLVGTVLTFPLAFILAFLKSDQDGWLDNGTKWGVGPRLFKWLSWFQTPDNSLDGDHGFQEKHNPCLKEQLITYKCLDKFGYVKEKCTLEMYNYNECKLFWGRVRADRRRKGIKPHLPEPQDRQKVKLEYLR